MTAFILQLILIFTNAGFSLSEENILHEGVKSGKIILDSDVSFEQATSNSEIPQNIISQLTLIHIKYVGFDGYMHIGQLLTHKSCADDLYEIFEELYKLEFPIYKVQPISEYDWSDDASMSANNSSSFNYRKILNTGFISKHASGKAIDINPLQNPQIKRGKIFPITADYNPAVPGTFIKNSKAVRIFKNKGWKWGGDWANNKDYQHFEK
ncbi:MAG: M15 family metallopeptidase [bacterium]